MNPGRAEAETGELARGVGERKLAVEEQARQLRKEIEALQTGEELSPAKGNSFANARHNWSCYGPSPFSAVEIWKTC